MYELEIQGDEVNRDDDAVYGDGGLGKEDAHLARADVLHGESSIALRGEDGICLLCAEEDPDDYRDDEQPDDLPTPQAYMTPPKSMAIRRDMVPPTKSKTPRKSILRTRCRNDDGVAVGREGSSQR